MPPYHSSMITQEPVQSLFANSAAQPALTEQLMKICLQFRQSPAQRSHVRAKTAEYLLALRWFAPRKVSLSPATMAGRGSRHLSRKHCRSAFSQTLADKTAMNARLILRDPAANPSTQRRRPSRTLLHMAPVDRLSETSFRPIAHRSLKYHRAGMFRGMARQHPASFGHQAPVSAQEPRSHRGTRAGHVR